MKLQAKPIVQATAAGPFPERTMLQQAKAMRQQGMYYHEIAAALGVARDVPRRWLIGENRPRTDTTNEKLASLFEAICDYKELHQGNSPSVRWLVKNSMYSSTSTVAYGLRALEDAGLITVTRDKARAIEIVGAKWVYEVVK